MKRNMLIAAGLVAAFLLGGIVGMNITSLFWKKLVEAGILGQSTAQVCQALAPLKCLHEGKTDAAISFLQQDVELGLAAYEMHHATFRGNEPMPELLVKARVILEETRKGTNGPNQQVQPIAGKPGSG